MSAAGPFEPYMIRWELAADGEPVTTPGARLLPVLRGAQPAMLKLSLSEEERLGSALLEWWGGAGAAQVFARDGEALLLERALGPGSLAEMARAGQDEEACRILCATAARLHAPRATPLPLLTPLADWFRALDAAAASHGGPLPRCADTARRLLAAPREVLPLHGDLHHDNVLDFGARGWLAIDAKGVMGERAFDFACLFANPDLADPSRPVATTAGRFARRVAIVAEAARLERHRLLQWILAWSGLSAAWFLADDDPLVAVDLQIGELAAAELDR